MEYFSTSIRGEGYIGYHHRMDRRRFVSLSLGAAAASRLARAETGSHQPPLRSPAYNQVTVLSEPYLAQQRNTLGVLMGLSDDSLLQPFRAMAGQPAPGVNIGGWYEYLPTYDYHHGDAGFAPGHSFGQWTSALARYAAASNDAVIATRVRGLHAQIAEAISPAFFDGTRFPAYTFDKLNCGLNDAHALLQDPQAFRILDTVRKAAMSTLPGYALPREIAWRKNRDKSFTWDEIYILPENLYLAYSMGAGPIYRAMAQDYLLDSFFKPLARNENVLGGLHGYSHVNALCSAMQAWFVDGSALHLQASINAFRMLEAQSYCTGGWAPDETLEKPGSDKLFLSLTKTHNSFETPCGAYAHAKLTRYLLQATRDGHYGDSMERILLNTALGARPLGGDGHSFYYADYNTSARRVDSAHRWPCCSGTLPQLAADYGINAYLLGLTDNPSVWVNLYLPSNLRWTDRHTQLTLTQDHTYPEADTVRLRLHASRPASFPLHLRIPEWATDVQLTVNGQPQALDITHGFAELHREWRNNDLIELHLPMQLRLESLRTDGGTPHPEIVSLLYGPLVLMPLAPMPTLSREQLLTAKRIGVAEWVIETAHSTLRLRPFTGVGDNVYSPYSRLAVSA